MSSLSLSIARSLSQSSEATGLVPSMSLCVLAEAGNASTSGRLRECQEVSTLSLTTGQH